MLSKKRGRQDHGGDMSDIPDRVTRRSVEEKAVPTRAQQLKRLASGEEFDVLVVGGGCTGAWMAAMGWPWRNKQKWVKISDEESQIFFWVEVVRTWNDMNQGMRGLSHAGLIPMRREDVHVMIWTRGVFLFCCSTPKVFFDFCIRNGLLVTTVQASYTVTLAPYSMTYTHAYIDSMHAYIRAYRYADMHTELCI